MFCSLTNGYGHPPMMMRIGPEMSIGPYMFMRNPYQQNIYDASNVQINYNDDKGQDDGLISEDETSKNEAIPRRRNVQRRLLVNNNFNEVSNREGNSDENDFSLDKTLDSFGRLEKSLHKSTEVSRCLILMTYPPSKPRMRKELYYQRMMIELDKSIELVT